jgi:Family of unknown function (DUF6051)
MSYCEDYNRLRTRFDHSPQRITLPEDKMEILNLLFQSANFNLLPGEKQYHCDEHGETFDNGYRIDAPQAPPVMTRLFNVDDSKIKENIHFSYPILRRVKKNDPKIKKAIILFHGLNEKSWDKYLPWAHKLVSSTGKAVIMFPMAFHMNRAPREWVDPRLMRAASQAKSKMFPNTVNSSLANAAINTRLQFLPQRFLWSGLQSYFDILQLIRQIQAGEHPYIHENAKIDFFAYSIGSFLAEILLMSNPDDLFRHSRLFNFCGGPILTRTSPVSKYILDSEANIAVYSFFIEHLDAEIKRDKRLAHYFGGDHPVGQVFRCMLDYHQLKDFREQRLRELSSRIMAIGLEKDKVIPPYEIVNTLKGEARKIPIKVKILDFSYVYDHVVPFPANKNMASEVDRGFKRVFKTAGRFLS